MGMKRVRPINILSYLIILSKIIATVRYQELASDIIGQHDVLLKRNFKVDCGQTTVTRNKLLKIPNQSLQLCLDPNVVGQNGTTRIFILYRTMKKIITFTRQVFNNVSNCLTVLTVIFFLCGYSSKHKESCWKWVFQFRYKHSDHIRVFPLSIREYFSALDKQSVTSKEALMNFEWARLESFCKFPSSSTVSGLRLAQSGFYYTGNDEEVVCFCCGLRNNSWNTNESVESLHKRLSPNCRLVNGEEANNVAINTTSRTSSRGNCAVLKGATGGPEDEHTTRLRNQMNGLTGSGRLTSHQISETVPGSSTSFKTSGSKCQSGNQPDECYGPSPPKAILTGTTDRFPGAVNERPKHPEYATKSTRSLSFSRWPDTGAVQPEQLIEAGFFYAGIEDCVRCFFCGGGVKNWEHGDSPWIEHARWFPNCAYVKHCKGLAFIQSCRYHDDNITQSLDHETNTNLIEDQHVQDLNSNAAALVLDMGYSQTQAEEAIKQARLKHGQSELKAQYLLDYLLESKTAPPNSGNPHVHKEPTEDSMAGEKSLSKYPDKDDRRALYEENKLLKEQMMCKICMDKDANVVFLPCGHMVACFECAQALRKCAVCRKMIQRKVRAYQS